jgi:hypothetical protein
MINKTEEHSVVSDLLFRGVEHSQMWMSHGDKVTKMPTGFVKIAHSDNSEHAAIAWAERKMFGLQFHPEVTHSVHGKVLLHNFVVGVCEAPADWNMKDIAEEFIKEVTLRSKIPMNRIELILLRIVSNGDQGWALLKPVHSYLCFTL